MCRKRRIHINKPWRHRNRDRQRGQGEVGRGGDRQTETLWTTVPHSPQDPADWDWDERCSPAGRAELILQLSCTFISGACCSESWGEASFPSAGLSARVCLLPSSLLFLPLCLHLSSPFHPSLNKTLCVLPRSPASASRKQHRFNKCQWLKNRDRAGEKTRAVMYKTFTQQYKKSNYWCSH